MLRAAIHRLVRVAKARFPLSRAVPRQCPTAWARASHTAYGVIVEPEFNFIEARLGVLILVSADPKTFSHHNQLGKGFGVHFSHEVAPMNLDRPFAYTDFARNLLVHEAARHQRHDLALAGG